MLQRIAALPSDVRRRLCPAARLEYLNEDYAPNGFVEEPLSSRPGRSPTPSTKLTAGQSRRRTSDGKAGMNYGQKRSTKHANHYDRRSNSLRMIDGSSRAVWVMLPVVKRFARRPKSVPACAE